MRAIKIILTALTFLSAVVLSAQEFKADIDKSEVKWTGRKVTGEHHGHIKLKSGVLILEHERIVSGNFTIDMKTITNYDLEDEELNKTLVGHLKSDDFFGVEKYPEATLVIVHSSKFRNGKAEVKGDLTIKEITHPVSFTVERYNGTYKASIVIDRAKYDVRYGSGSFFDNLGDKLIYDDFTVGVKLVVE